MKRLFLMITAALLAVSCSEKNIGEETAAKIIIGTKSINAAAEGGKYDFGYTIEGNYDGNIYVGYDCDWITVDVGDSSIFLDIEPNPSEDARTATLSFGVNGSDAVFVLVVQKGKTPEPVNEEMFSIDVADITTNSATVSIAPAGGHNKTYLYSVVDKKSYELYGSKAYIEACIKQIDYLIELSIKYDPVPRTFGDFLLRNASVNPASSLNDDTEYYAVAFDLDVNKKYSGNITLKEFKTNKAAQSSNKFKLQMQGSVLSVTTTNNDTYICDVLTKESWSEFATPREVAQMFVSTMKSYGYLGMYIVSGSQSKDFASTLDHSGNYVAYAFGYSDDSRTGGITTEIEYIEFSYKASASSATITRQGRISASVGKPMINGR